ncbi:insulin-like growth factor-binding protein-related protein 1 [Saccostrea cucullata]|uniref:insulin-like growth factor-binding protein-related protein 1 n=1 Tax=Saccostrea cuccullata TaxID=36930 RepID=UPI002ED2DC94
MNGVVYLSCFLGFLCLSMGQVDIPADCGVCDRSACPSQEDMVCKAGITRDRCKCCQVCAQAEGEVCDLPGQGNTYPKCGDYLTCVQSESNNDLGVCVCDYQDNLCGTDDVTYTSICKLREAQSKKGRDLKVQSSGPCKSAPRILTGPDSVTNVTGDNVVLICEAAGYPIPHIGWLFQRTDTEISNLPGDDMSVSTVSRGGPEKYQVTGWLQVEQASKHHEGYYICVAHNKLGSDKKTGRIKIHEKVLNRVERKEDGDQI